jgi:hypothetical protein
MPQTGSIYGCFKEPQSRARKQRIERERVRKHLSPHLDQSRTIKIVQKWLRKICWGSSWIERWVKLCREESVVHSNRTVAREIVRKLSASVLWQKSVQIITQNGENLQKSRLQKATWTKLSCCLFDFLAYFDHILRKLCPSSLWQAMCSTDGQEYQLPWVANNDNNRYNIYNRFNGIYFGITSNDILFSDYFPKSIVNWNIISLKNITENTTIFCKLQVLKFPPMFL